MNPHGQTINTPNSLLAILVFLLVIAVACQPATNSVPASTATPFRVAERALRRNLQKWQEAGIPHYRFRLTIRCFCPDIQGPLLIEVKNDKITSMKYQSGNPMDAASREYFENYGTINRIFSLVTNELNAKRKEVDVTYDPNYGFPLEFFTDFHEGADDELTLIIEDFEVLP